MKWDIFFYTEKSLISLYESMQNFITNGIKNIDFELLKNSYFLTNIKNRIDVLQKVQY